MIKPENREINSLNGITPLLDFLHARIVPPTSLIGSAGSIFSLPGLAIAPSVRKSATRGSKPRPSATTAALPCNERGRHSLLLNGDEWAQGSPNLAKVAFTLAEVLITLGVIGVVAAMTLPTLIQNYKRHEVETRLAKFYTTMNEAIRMSETVNGDKMYWEELGKGFEEDEDGNIDKTKSIPMAWYKKYLQPYLNVVKTEIEPVQGRVMIYFNDGSLCLLSGESLQIFPRAKDFKHATVLENGTVIFHTELSGIKYFTFLFYPELNSVKNKYHYKKGVEPYKYGWDGNIETLYTKSTIGCNENATNERAYCTALIQMNGWKIPKDYPFKF